MINAVIADKDVRSIDFLQEQLNAYCPHIEVGGVALSQEQAVSLTKDLQPELLFLETSITSEQLDAFLKQSPFPFETILMSSSPKLNLYNLRYQVSGYLKKPIQIDELVVAVHHAQHWLQLRSEQLETRRLILQLIYQSPPKNVVGIPTIEGIEFLKISDIIRCEGLQRYTRVVTINAESIISSYSIGVFQKLLLPFGFFSPHKSHLVNLIHLQRFLIEGTIIMVDGSSVPVSRRRRNAFLAEVNHL